MKELTKRQAEVMAGIMLGLSDKEIAAALGITLHTQKHHVVDIAKKMEIDRNRYSIRARIVYLVAPSWSCPLFRRGCRPE